MEKILFLFILSCFLFFSCASDQVTDMDEAEELPVLENQIPEDAAATVPDDNTPAVIIEEEPDIIVIDESEEPGTEPEVISEPEPEEEIVVSDEYLRSISNLSGEDVVVVPPEVFEDDKNQIFQIINNLDKIMKKKDFDAWYEYLTPESAEYWSNRHNLLELSRHLFALDNFHINNIREYFEYFFIPARRGRIVDEIRYVTPYLVKVVQYKNKTDIIYYFFEKTDDTTWKLSLDTL